MLAASSRTSTAAIATRVALGRLSSRFAVAPVASALSAKTRLITTGTAQHVPQTPEELQREQPSDLVPFTPAPMRHNVRAHQGPWKSKELEDMDIHLKDHRVPSSAVDWFALRIVKMLRHLPDMFFRDKYVHRAVMLETVAAVPGMVGGMLRHLRSLRRMQHDGGWVGHLLHEAENERMHLMTWMRLMKPTFFERSLVIAVQGIFFNAFFVLYVLSPRLAHRIVGYLEEEAVISYTHMLREIDAGRIDNGPAPEIAIAYYNLAPDATIRDVVLAVRADEALHRDVNHHFSDRILLRRENLREELTHEKAQSLSGKVGPTAPTAEETFARKPKSSSAAAA